jgi:hypothetical protein
VPLSKYSPPPFQGTLPLRTLPGTAPTVGRPLPAVYTGKIPAKMPVSGRLFGALSKTTAEAASKAQGRGTPKLAPGGAPAQAAPKAATPAAPAKASAPKTPAAAKTPAPKAASAPAAAKAPKAAQVSYKEGFDLIDASSMTNSAKSSLKQGYMARVDKFGPNSGMAHVKRGIDKFNRDAKKVPAKVGFRSGKDPVAELIRSVFA